MNKLSVVILARNGMPVIQETLASVKWADEILVVDSGSIDETWVECDKYPNCNVLRIEWMGFGKTHHFAVNNAKNDWILNIDQDEIVTEKLKEKVLCLLSDNNLEGCFKIKRINYYINRKINYIWKSDYPERLFNRKFDNFVDEEVPHEFVEKTSKVKKIEEHIIHHTIPTFKFHIEKMNSYTDNGAKYLHKKGKNGSLILAMVHSCFKFIKLYFINLGFLDGRIGLILSLNGAYYVFLKYIKLWEISENNK